MKNYLVRTYFVKFKFEKRKLIKILDFSLNVFILITSKPNKILILIGPVYFLTMAALSAEPLLKVHSICISTYCIHSNKIFIITFETSLNGTLWHSQKS